MKLFYILLLFALCWDTNQLKLFFNILTAYLLFRPCCTLAMRKSHILLKQPKWPLKINIFALITLLGFILMKLNLSHTYMCSVAVVGHSYNTLWIAKTIDNLCFKWNLWDKSIGSRSSFIAHDFTQTHTVESFNCLWKFSSLLFHLCCMLKFICCAAVINSAGSSFFLP